MKPQDVVRRHADLIASLLTPSYGGYMGLMLPKLLGLSDRVGGPAAGLSREDWAATGLDWCASAAHSLARAASYLIDADAVPLIRRAADDLPDTVAVTEELLPSPDGFVVFAEPYEMVDVNGKAMLTRALSWSMLTPAELQEHVGEEVLSSSMRKGGVLVIFYASFGDRDDARDGVDTRELRKRLGDLTVYHQTGIPMNTPLGEWPAYRQAQRLRGSAPVEAGALEAPVTAALSLWLLMRQPIIDTDEQPRMPRGIPGRTKRERLPGRISVVRLRRRPREDAPQPGPGQTAASWSCRWKVRGHWHRYRTGVGRVGVEWRYVHEYEKGDPELPLRERPKRVYRVTGEPVGDTPEDFLSPPRRDAASSPRL